MMLSLAQAGQATGLNRSTILRAIKAGKLSATRNANNEWTVDPAELHRVYPPVQTHSAPSEASPDANQGALDTHKLMEAAEQRIIELKALVEDLRGQRDKWEAEAQAWRTDAHTWREQHQAVQLALTDQRRQPEPVAEPEPVPARSWWPWRRAG